MSRLVKCPFIFHAARRAFSVSVAEKPKRTRKKISELPKVHLLPDGTPAAALPEWHSATIADLSPKHVQESKPKRVRKSPSASSKASTSGTPKRKLLVKDGADDGPPRNVLAREILDNLTKFPHCLLLTRVGQFYESYFDQAIEISRLLNIKLTTRKWDGQRIAMCGFPIMHIDKYLKVLVQTNKRFVAMCEEFPKYLAAGTKEFERRVVRVITPGTLIDESFLNQYENNYLLAVSAEATPQYPIGLAWIDVSTGEFYSKPTTTETLRDEITRIGPREVLLPKQFQLQQSHPILEALLEEHNFVTFVDQTPRTVTPSDPQNIVLETENGSPISHLPPEDVSASIASLATVSSYTPEETSAIELLTGYLKSNLLDHMPPLLLPNREDADRRMQIDSHTIKALEIRESTREGGVKGSLLNVVKRTTTSSGTRLLARWLCSPSTSIHEINTRQSLVAFFHARPHFHSDMLELLGRTEDASRIVQRFLLGRGDSNDLSAISSAISIWSDLRARVAHERRMESEESGKYNKEEWASMDALMSRMVDLDDLAKRISTSIGTTDPEASSEALDSDDVPEADETLTTDESPTRLGASVVRKWTINPKFSAKLTDIHELLQDLLKQKESLQNTLQITYDAPSLTLRYSPGLGMNVHLAKSKRDQGKLNKDTSFISIAESGSTKAYFYQEWSLLGSKIFDASMSLAAAEKEAFETLRAEVNAHASLLRRNARIIDELDVTLAFASLASEMNFVRPTIREDTCYNVVNGRHPTVELGLLTSGRVFTPNSVQMSEDSRLHIITGPNMAGKSTLLRQTALIVILAQTGSFVPADCATIGIVDRLFSRVGAKDDLFHDRSTFMVEMLETAEILRRATSKSLVIMDEVGRGTTVQDGLSIAFATVHHLLHVNKCRALFATHFHEIADILGYSNAETYPDVSFFCTDVDETEDGHFSYSYRIRPGVNRNSHGLKVAQLAGMPRSVIDIAQKTIAALEARALGSPADLNAFRQSL